MLPPTAPRLGVDIVRVDRFSDQHVGEALLRRIFTLEELTIIPDGPRRAERLAGRWAAKEAVAKALGCGFGERLTFREVEILKDERGAPYVRFAEEAALRHGHPQISISITHDGDYAAAVAVMVKP